MKRIVPIICLILFLAGAVLAQSELKMLLPAYWIVGTIPDTYGASANGRYVDFFKELSDLDNGDYAQGIVVGNQFILNAFAIWPLPLTVGGKYKVATERRTDTYGASGEVTISGIGWDEVKGLALVDGGGIGKPIKPPKNIEPGPRIKLWFGNRLYQKELFAKGMKQIVAPRPEIRIEVNIEPPYTIDSNIDNYSLVLDSGQRFALTAQNVGQKSFHAMDVSKLTAMSIKYTMVDALSAGEHVFSVTANSSGAMGSPSTATELATVEVMGGPLQVVGQVLTFPSPFSVAKDKQVTIQYALSMDSDIDIIIVSGAKVTVKKILCNLAAEGGSAGLNKVTWDGITDQGSPIGNGIYSGAILARGEGRVLARFKLSVVSLPGEL